MRLGLDGWGGKDCFYKNRQDRMKTEHDKCSHLRIVTIQKPICQTKWEAEETMRRSSCLKRFQPHPGKWHANNPTEWDGSRKEGKKVMWGRKTACPSKLFCCGKKFITSWHTCWKNKGEKRGRKLIDDVNEVSAAGSRIWNKQVANDRKTGRRTGWNAGRGVGVGSDGDRWAMVHRMLTEEAVESLESLETSQSGKRKRQLPLRELGMLTGLRCYHGTTITLKT